MPRSRIAIMKEFDVRIQMNNQELTPIQSGLTGSPNNPTLNVKGPRQSRGKNIFMPDGPGNPYQEPTPKTHGEPPIGRDITPSEDPKKTPQKKNQHTRHDTSRVSSKEARQAWEAHYNALGRDFDTLPQEDRSTVELAIAEGRVPDSSLEIVAHSFEKLIQAPEDIQRTEDVRRRISEATNITAMADIIDPATYPTGVLQDTAAEFMTEVAAAASRGEFPDLNYIKEVRMNIRSLREANPAIAAEANRLIGEINTWMAEGMKKDRRESYRQHGLPEITKKYSPQELLTDRKKRDEVFNEIFAGVDAAPNEFWREAFNTLTRGMDLEAFTDLVRNGSVGRTEEYGVAGLTEPQIDALKRDLQRYQIDRQIRQTLHDVNAVLYLPSVPADKLFENMQQFSSSMGDYAFRQAGITEMMDLYEMALREDMMKNNGYLDPEAVTGKVETIIEDDGTTTNKVNTGEVEVKTKERFRELLKKRKVIMRTNNAETYIVDTMEDWEIDRIFSMSRGMMIMTERLISIAAESRLPKGDAAYGSLFMQDVIQSYSPYRHLLMKYGVTESGLAAFMYKDKEGNSLMDIMGLWSPEELKKNLKKMNEDRTAFMEEYLNDPDIGNFPYLMRMNPNMAGDMFTWLSWRAGEKADVISMSQRFLEEGRKRMEVRLSDGKKPAGLSDEEYLDEYANWMGTGLRLERLRGKLTNYESRDPEKKIASGKAVVKAVGIIERMATLQPHRLYAGSNLIRKRILDRLSPDEKINFEENIEAMLEDLNLVERTVLERREWLLDQGITFDNVSLEDTTNPYLDFFNVIDDPVRRENAKKLSWIVRQDFSANKKAYKNEFIYKREYTHGFVLWSGDAPLNEFNASALGPTGGFARRARDNTNQAKASVEEIKLLGILGNANSQEQVVQGLKAIYDGVSQYDSGKAKQVIADKVEGIIKFYAADWPSQIPVLGTILGKMKRSSFAQSVYGKSAMVWQPAEARAFLVKIKDAHMIDDVQFKELADKGFANHFAVGRDIGVAMAQIMALAFAIYMFEELRKEKR